MLLSRLNGHECTSYVEINGSQFSYYNSPSLILRFHIKMGVRVIIGKQRPLPFLSYRFYGNDSWIENHRSRFQWFLHATKEANSITISTLLPLLHTSRSSGITKVVPFLSSRGHKPLELVSFVSSRKLKTSMDIEWKRAQFVILWFEAMFSESFKFGFPKRFVTSRW